MLENFEFPKFRFLFPPVQYPDRQPLLHVLQHTFIKKKTKKTWKYVILEPKSTHFEKIEGWKMQ